jgi:glyoxylase-like metal-dependent hydrolase (beta-lactamase superfamily II)
MKIFVSGKTSVYMVGGGGVGLSHPCDSHVYVIENGGEAALIDAGSGITPQNIRDRVIDDGIAISSIKTVILTHSHWDHGRGAAWWVAETGARLAVHRLGVPTLEETLWPTSHVECHGAVSRPVKVHLPLEDGDEIRVGDIALTVIHTPGHSDDSISLHATLGSLSILFRGDTCFAEGGHGTVNADTDFRAYRASVRRLDAMKIDVLFPGHKHFVLSRAFAHIALLERKMSGNWTDVVASRVPFFPTWWLEHDPSLYEDALDAT